MRRPRGRFFTPLRTSIGDALYDDDVIPGLMYGLRPVRSRHLRRPRKGSVVRKARFPKPSIFKPARADGPSSLASIGMVPKLVPLMMSSSPLRSSDSTRSEEHTSELQSRLHLVCRLLLA